MICARYTPLRRIRSSAALISTCCCPPDSAVSGMSLRRTRSSPSDVMGRRVSGSWKQTALELLPPLRLCRHTYLKCALEEAVSQCDCNAVEEPEDLAKIENQIR